MRLCCGLLGNLILEARLAAEEAGAAPERRVVVLESEEVLLPEDAEFGEFGLVEATQEEREALRQAGYSMPDW
jgi:hypothetical protein